MHAVRIAATAVALGTALAGLSSTTPANAEDGPGGADCERVSRVTGQCWIMVPQPDNGGRGGGSATPTGGSRPGRACYWDPAKQGLSKPPAGPVPCTSDAGYWSNTYNCYLQPMKPPPSAGDPAWQGHEPGDGAVYQCYQPQTGMVLPLWSANPPPGAARGPSPAEVAQMAIAAMRLKAIDIGIVPKPGPDSLGVVGMPTWMWVDGPSATTFGPITKSASAGGITVTATANVEQIEWDMGDGSTVTCEGEGTAYYPAAGKQDSPDCGHRYEMTSWDKPGHEFTVTARSYWRVDWAGAGQSGTIRLDPLEQSVQIRVGELQVLTQ